MPDPHASDDPPPGLLALIGIVEGPPDMAERHDHYVAEYMRQRHGEPSFQEPPVMTPDRSSLDPLDPDAEHAYVDPAVQRLREVTGYDAEVVLYSAGWSESMPMC